MKAKQIYIDYVISKILVSLDPNTVLCLSNSPTNRLSKDNSPHSKIKNNKKKKEKYTRSIF